MQSDASCKSPRWRMLFICTALTVVTLAAWWPVLDCGFVNYDDDFHVTSNSQVQAGLTASSLRWAFTTLATSNWHPITWLSHMLGCAIYGLNPSGHHLTSLLIHCANALLIFVLLARLTGALWPGAIVAALFALHPLHVESVAWVSERKDVLSTLFWLLASFVYVSYAQSGGTRRYLLVVALFVIGLMCKPMVVSLPIVLLLLDYWPLARIPLEAQKSKPNIWTSLVIEKSPLFGLAAASCLITWLAQGAGHGAAGRLGEIPFAVRLDNALVSYIAYLGKTLWPAKLAVIYPHPLRSIPVWQVMGSGLLFALISALAVGVRRARPYVFVGWFWYVVTLIPVIGLVQVGEQGMADRYTYIPLIGIFIAIAWGLDDLRAKLFGSRLRRIVLTVPIVLVFTALFVLTRVQIGVWRDSVSLFTHALSVTRNNYVAHLNLAIALDSQGDTKSAEDHYEAALGLQPGWAEALYNYAVFLAKKGETARAIDLYSRAIQARPGYLDARYNLGVLYDNLGRTRDAVREYQAVIRMAPDHAQAHNNIAIAFYNLGRYADAWKHAHAAESLGFRPHPGFIQALSSQMPEPE